MKVIHILLFLVVAWFAQMYAIAFFEFNLTDIGNLVWFILLVVEALAIILGAAFIKDVKNFIEES